MTKERILELVKECFTDECYDPIEDAYLDIPTNVGEIEKFYTLAHQDGQRAMRERAANVCEQLSLYENFNKPTPVIEGAEAIRSLEIENE